MAGPRSPLVGSKKRDRIKVLERKVLELESQLASAYHFAALGLSSATRDRTMGSAVVVQMHYLGGKEVCPPFALKDGLSAQLITALRGDLKYSYDLATQDFKP